MKQNGFIKKATLKKADSLGIHLIVKNIPSGKLLFPEKLERANKILSGLNFVTAK